MDASPVSVVLRIDDAGRNEPRLAALVGLLLARDFPIALQIVPGWLVEEFVDCVRRLVDVHGPRIELGQHGWRHADQAPAAERAYEFGPTRSRQQQRDDIRRGRDRLAAAFPQQEASVFSPPHDRLDQTTLDLLAELGHRIVTGGPRTLAGLSLPRGLLALPCRVDASAWVSGERRLRDVGELCADMRRQATPVVGVALHALEIRDAASLAQLVAGFEELRDAGTSFQTFHQASGS
jgi:peptidoglycan/xylan/chitin deacetylase (PgdA/CDA1 family)